MTAHRGVVSVLCHERSRRVIQPVGEDNFDRAVQFLIEWVSDGEPAAREHLADHATGGGASLIAVRNNNVIGIVTIRWQSNYAGFRDHGIPLVHQIAVAGPSRRLGVATLLMDAAEGLARDGGIMTLGITVGLFDEYGPAQRLYALRGYVPRGEELESTERRGILVSKIAEGRC